MTRKAALAFGIGASLMLAAGMASAAGTCGTEVAALQQQLGLEQGANARTGPTDAGTQQPSPSASVGTGTSTTVDSDQVANGNSGANATIGTTDPGVQQPVPEANATTGTGTSTGTSPDMNNGSSVNTTDNTGANATIGATDPGVQQPNGGGSDTLAQDNASSGSTSGSSDTMNSGTGTITETSRVGEMNTAAGGRAEAITALKKAQIHADAGNEDACMTELNAAKTALGMQ